MKKSVYGLFSLGCLYAMLSFCCPKPEYREEDWLKKTDWGAIEVDIYGGCAGIQPYEIQDTVKADTTDTLKFEKNLKKIPK